MGVHISVPGGQSFKLKVYGNATVTAGNGNDTVEITKNGKITIGDGNNKLNIHGNGTIKAGDGNDSITIGKNAHITVGGGNDTINMKSGTFNQIGAGGHDTINLGCGNDTIIVQGQASIHGSFGNASLVGGELTVRHHGNVEDVTARSGCATLVGGSGKQEFIGGSGYVNMDGGKGSDTLVGGTGHDTMHGGAGNDYFSFLATAPGGQHLVTDFVHGHDKLYLEGHSLSWLQCHGAITTSGGNTYISLDGGATTVELKGVTNLTNSDVTTHKP